jgi:hypothetical protein
MSINEPNPFSHQLIALDKEKEFIQSYNWNYREGMKEEEEFTPILDVIAGQPPMIKGWQTTRVSRSDSSR